MEAKKSFRIAGYAVAFVVMLFILFPLEYLRSGVGQRFAFSSINWATNLTEWQWKSDIKYNCANVSLLGYTTPWGKIVPIIVDGNESNIAPIIEDDRVAYVKGSDVVRRSHDTFLSKASEFNRLIIAECDFGRFARKPENAS